MAWTFRLVRRAKRLVKLVPPAGFEPALSPPEGDAVSNARGMLTSSNARISPLACRDFGTYSAREPDDPPATIVISRSSLRVTLVISDAAAPKISRMSSRKVPGPASEVNVLSLMVSMVEQAADYALVSLGIEISVHGTVYSGQLISARRYFAEMAQDFSGRDGFDQVLSETLIMLQRSADEEAAENSARLRAQPRGEPPTTPKFLHLSTPDGDARRLWSIPIVAVDAWALGAFAYD